MKREDIKPGQKVWFLDDIPATVRGVRSNGVIIEYWGIGHQREQLKVERVSARYLTLDVELTQAYA